MKYNLYLTGQKFNECKLGDTNNILKLPCAESNNALRYICILLVSEDQTQVTHVVSGKL